MEFEAKVEDYINFNQAPNHSSLIPKLAFMHKLNPQKALMYKLNQKPSTYA